MPKRTSTTILREAYTLWSDPKNRCRGVLARGRYREDICPTSPEARHWCPAGAIAKVGRLPVDHIRVEFKDDPLVARALGRLAFQLARLYQHHSFKFSSNYSIIYYCNDHSEAPKRNALFEKAFTAAIANHRQVRKEP